MAVCLIVVANVWSLYNCDIRKSGDTKERICEKYRQLLNFASFVLVVDVATSVCLLVSFKCRRRDNCMFTCFIQVSTTRQPHFYLFHSRLFRVLAVCVYLARPLMAWRLYFYKEITCSQVILQTCFVGVRCGCRSTCLHEMQPRHNLLRHGTNDE